MPTDVDAPFWTQWTTQPGPEGTELHVGIVSGVEGNADIKSEITEDVLADPYLVEPATQSGAISLRDYQRKAISAIDMSWRKGNSAPLVVLPCGVGKTIVAAQVMSTMYGARGSRSLFVAHRKELLDQTAEKIRLVSPLTRVGVVQAKRDQLGRDVTVASIQTIGHRSQARLQKLLDNGPYDVFVIDEAHHAPSPQYVRVIDAIREQNPNVLLLGLTATPGRHDGTALDTVFDDVAFHRSTIDMIEAGWLVPPKGFRVTLDVDLDRVGVDNGDFVRSQLSKLMNTPDVNRVVVEAWQTYGLDRRTVAFSVDVAHAEALRVMFSDAGYSAEVIHSGTKDRERTAVLKRFREGQTKILVNCEIFTEGFDEPSIECVLYARPTQSQSLFIQSVGRGLRLYPGKSECIIIDCVGNSDKHQLVQLATLAGFDPDRSPEGEGGAGDEREEDETPEVLGASSHGEEVELTRRRLATTRYRWRETSLGWLLQIPRIGYYLVAWHNRGANSCVIRFYDQRPGKRDDVAREVLRDPIDFQMAYGLVESECDRIFNASSNREWADRTDHGEMPPEMAFVDLDEGMDEPLDVPEAWILRDGAWRERPVTAKQMALLEKLGVKTTTLPETTGEASDLITIMQAERDFKMRLPPTSKQIAYLKINGLPITKTKGAAARAIWQHRKKGLVR